MTAGRILVAYSRTRESKNTRSYPESDPGEVIATYDISLGLSFCTRLTSSRVLLLSPNEEKLIRMNKYYVGGQHEFNLDVREKFPRVN